MNTATTVGSINFLKSPIYACLKSIFKKQAIFLINNFQNLFHVWLNLQQQQKIQNYFWYFLRERAESLSRKKLPLTSPNYGLTYLITLLASSYDPHYKKIYPNLISTDYVLNESHSKFIVSNLDPYKIVL